MTDTAPVPTPPPASPSFWRWLRPSPKVAEKPKEQLHQTPDEMEERLLALLAGVHQQVVADAQHTEQLATLSRRRSDVRVSALEEQQRRLDIRLNDMLVGLKNIEKAAPAASLSQLHVELSELRRSVRLVASNQQEACKREDELQEHMCQRLKPLEDRLSSLEGEIVMARPCPGETVQLVEALGSEKSFRSVETNNEEPSTVSFPILMDQGLKQLERRLDEELQRVQAQIDAFSKSDADDLMVRALDQRIAACEASCQRVDVFVERFKDLAAKVQEGFADARGHLDQVLAHLEPKPLQEGGVHPNDGLERMRGTLLDIKSSVDSLAHRLEDLDDRQLLKPKSAVARPDPNDGTHDFKNDGLRSAALGTNCAGEHTAHVAPWAELAQLSSALDGFEAAIQQAESSLGCRGSS